MAKQPISALRRTAGEVKKYRILLRLVPIVIGIVALSLTVVYVVAVLYGRYGSFTVGVDKYNAMKYGLTLSETKDFSSSTSRINAQALAYITNIDGETLPKYLNEIDGEHNGENYAAYTFYCKNAGTVAVNYQYQLSIGRRTNGIEKAARIVLYVNDVPTTYAHTATDGSGPEPNTVAFARDNIVVEKTISQFNPGDVTKFTVVIYLEGNDPDCLDPVIGGTLNVDMYMTVIGEAVTEEPPAEE